MRFYIAGNINNRESVKKAMEAVRQAGHEILTNWTDDRPIAQSERNGNQEKISEIAVRDFLGVNNCEVFVLFAEPADGRSLYVELGVALATCARTGEPKIYVVGGNVGQTVFYFHPLVVHVNGIEEILVDCTNPKTQNVAGEAGRLEEFRALRSEMLQIINDRLWGPATFAVLCAATMGLMTPAGDNSLMMVVLVFLPIPFMLHTRQREKSRFRMATYIKNCIEPYVSGMGWERYVDSSRKKGTNKGQGHMNCRQRFDHILALCGLYLLVPVLSLICLHILGSPKNRLLFGWIGLLVVILVGKSLWNVYDRPDIEKRGE